MLTQSDPYILQPSTDDVMMSKVNMGTLSTLLKDQLTHREKAQSGPKLQWLNKVLNMSKTGAMSNMIALSEGVDLKLINKGLCVCRICSLLVLDLMYCI